MAARSQGYRTISGARHAAVTRARKTNETIRIIYDDDCDVYRTTKYPTAWPQYPCVDTVTPGLSERCHACLDPFDENSATGARSWCDETRCVYCYQEGE